MLSSTTPCPGIGHACGHNIIATAGLGAGLAAAALADEAGGRVVVLGTPAEEGGGGKILMAREGAFDGIDAAMMVHPAGDDLARMDVIAVQELTATYTGQAAHAAAFPHRGRNALDAAVLGYLNVAALRQHTLPDERIHGVFLEAGEKPNIVPARAVTEWMVRSTSIATLAPLKARVAACLEAGRRGRRVRGRHRVEERRLRRHARQRGDGRALRRQRRRARADGRRAPRRSGRRRQHRHGQRQLPGAVDPPDDRGRPVGPAHPHARLRRPRPVRVGRPGRRRRRHRHGLDGRRPLGRGRASSRPSEPSSPPPWSDRGPDAQRSAIAVVGGA